MMSWTLGGSKRLVNWHLRTRAALTQALLRAKRQAYEARQQLDVPWRVQREFGVFGFFGLRGDDAINK